MKVYSIALLICFTSMPTSALELKSLSLTDLDNICKEWRQFVFQEKEVRIIDDWTQIVKSMCTQASGVGPEVEFWAAYEPKEAKVEAILEGEYGAGRKDKNNGQYIRPPYFYIQHIATAPSNLSIPENKQRKRGQGQALIQLLIQHMQNQSEKYKDVAKILLYPNPPARQAYINMGFQTIPSSENLELLIQRKN